ncbi:hypothetical protein [Streptomyces bullii]|uniref:Uncharacterized protein n=1 Tax=Streptomyces bullii TaxID=349910 RepID=A0ABW0UL25_9ACTN
MAFRRSVPQAELRAKLTPEQQARHGTDYQASRGGWLKPTKKPTPAKPKKG